MSTNSTEKPTPLVQETPAAPASFLELVTEAGEKALQQLTEAQAAFLQATEKVAEDVTEPATFTIPTLGSIDLKLPSAREVVEAHFTLIDKYVSNQKAYADQVLKAFGA